MKRFTILLLPLGALITIGLLFGVILSRENKGSLDLITQKGDPSALAPFSIDLTFTDEFHQKKIEIIGGKVKKTTRLLNLQERDQSGTSYDLFAEPYITSEDNITIFSHTTGSPDIPDSERSTYNVTFTDTALTFLLTKNQWEARKFTNLTEQVVLRSDLRVKEEKYSITRYTQGERHITEGIGYVQTTLGDVAPLSNAKLSGNGLFYSAVATIEDNDYFVFCNGDGETGTNHVYRVDAYSSDDTDYITEDDRTFLVEKDGIMLGNSSVRGKATPIYSYDIKDGAIITLGLFPFASDLILAQVTDEGLVLIRMDTEGKVLERKSYPRFSKEDSKFLLNAQVIDGGIYFGLGFATNELPEGEKAFMILSPETGLTPQIEGESGLLYEKAFLGKAGLVMVSANLDGSTPELRSRIENGYGFIETYIQVFDYSGKEVYVGKIQTDHFEDQRSEILQRRGGTIDSSATPYFAKIRFLAAVVLGEESGK